MKKNGRPKGSKTKPPVIANESYALKFIEKREKTINKSRALTPLAETERQYLTGLLNIFEERISPLVMDGRAEYQTNDFRYAPRQMFNNIMTYFRVSIEYGQPLTIMQMCAFNGMDFDHLKPKKIGNLPEAFSFLKDCVKFIEMYMEFTGQKKNNPAFQIFWLKNRGWQDKFEVEAVRSEGALTDIERDAAQKRIAAFSEERMIDAKLVNQPEEEKIEKPL